MAEPFSRKRKDGSLAWYGRVKLHTGDWDTPRLRGAKDKSSARKLNHELQAAEDRLAHGLGGGALFAGTFGELCDLAWDKHLKTLGGAKAEASRLHIHGGAKADRDEPGPSRLGSLPARLVTASQLEEYFAELATTPTVRGKPMDAKTINRIRDTFAIVFATAMRFGRWPKGVNPARDTMERTVAKTKVGALPVDAILPAIENAGDYWDGPLAVCLLAGLRRGEMIRARKEDVDLERRILVVRNTKGNRIEALPIHDALVPYLDKWLRSPGAWLFPNHEGGQRSTNQRFDLRLQAILVRAGVVDHYQHRCRRSACPLRTPGKRGGYVEQHQDDAARRCPGCAMKLTVTPKAPKVGWHVTRHTFGTAALKSGASLQSVQKLMRHSDPRLTTETYGHLDIAHLDGELARVSLRGVAAPAQHERAAAKDGKERDWVTRSRIAHAEAPREFAAPLRRGPESADPSDIPNAEPSMKKAVGFVEPRGIEPLTYALRMHGRPTHEHPQASQALATASDFSRKPSVSALHGSAAKSGCFMAFAAPVRRGKSSASQAPNPGRAMPEQASAPSSEVQREADAILLTVPQVADRLQVSKNWVWARINAGELAPTRIGGTRLRVSEEALAAYLRRHQR